MIAAIRGKDFNLANVLIGNDPDTMKKQILSDKRCPKGEYNLYEMMPRKELGKFNQWFHWINLKYKFIKE